MCYSEFGEILPAIREMDADVVSIEAARSQMDFLRQLSPGNYPNGIGPGVYDIHTPRVPSVAEFERLIHEALQVFRPEQLWVNALLRPENSPLGRSSTCTEKYGTRGTQSSDPAYVSGNACLNPGQSHQ